MFLRSRALFSENNFINYLFISKAHQETKYCFNFCCCFMFYFFLLHFLLPMMLQLWFCHCNRKNRSEKQPEKISFHFCSQINKKRNWNNSSISRFGITNNYSLEDEWFLFPFFSSSFSMHFSCFLIFVLTIFFLVSHLIVYSIW